MCRVFTFHHLCGHVHSTRVLPCASPSPFTSASPAYHAQLAPDPDSKILSPSPSCADTTNNPHLYPTLCDTCKKIGVISEWFEKTPGARFEAIMEWRRADGRESCSKARSRSNSHSADGDALADGKYRMRNAALVQDQELERMPFIRLMDNDSQSTSSTSEEERRSDNTASTAITATDKDDAESKTPASSPSPAQQSSVNPAPNAPTEHTLSTRLQSSRALLQRMAALNQRMRKRIHEARLPLPRAVPAKPTTSSSMKDHKEEKKGEEDGKFDYDAWWDAQ